MKSIFTLIAFIFTLGTIVPAHAQTGAYYSYGGFKSTYDVTITNITKGEHFTPALIASHRSGVSLFSLGESASQEMAVLAESGNTGPLQALLEATGRVLDIQTTGGLLAPGESVTVELSASGLASRLSIASMLIPTNDAFMAVNSKRLPGFRQQRTFRVSAYDAGSEQNDELCISIPGPLSCGGGEGVSQADGEGFIHTHSGIHGNGDLEPSVGLSFNAK